MVANATTTVTLAGRARLCLRTIQVRVFGSLSACRASTAGKGYRNAVGTSDVVIQRAMYPYRTCAVVCMSIFTLRHQPSDSHSQQPAPVVAASLATPPFQMAAPQSAPSPAHPPAVGGNSVSCARCPRTRTAPQDTIAQHTTLEGGRHRVPTRWHLIRRLWRVAAICPTIWVWDGKGREEGQQGADPALR